MTSVEQLGAEQKVARYVEEQIIARASTGIQKLPMLDVIFSRLATDLTSVFKTRLGILAEIEARDVTYSPWGSAMAALDQFSLCAVAAAEPWDGTFVLAHDPGLFHAICELQLSGKPDPAALPKRAPTTIERRMAMRISQMILDETTANFARLADVSLQARAIETPQQAGSMQSSMAACAVASMDIKLGDCGGSISFILPLGSLEPLSKSLSKMFLGDNLQGDGSWRSLMSSRIDSSNVEIQALMHRARVPIAEVLGWKAGDVLDLAMDPNGQITVTCTGIEIMKAAAGHRRNRVSLRVIGDLDAEAGPVDAAGFRTQSEANA